MDGLTIILESLRLLHELSKKEKIFFDDVPEKFKADLHKFIIGETLTIIEGKIVIGHYLYRQWLRKLNTKGFDYEIDWKQ
jgi:hypothetical protein